MFDSFDAVNIALITDYNFEKALTDAEEKAAEETHSLYESTVEDEDVEDASVVDEIEDEVDYDETLDDATEMLDMDAEDYRKIRDEVGGPEDDEDGELIDIVMGEDMLEEDL